MSEGIVDPLSVVMVVLNLIEEMEGVGVMWNVGFDGCPDLAFLSFYPWFHCVIGGGILRGIVNKGASLFPRCGG